jgi:uncharacterized protein
VTPETAASEMTRGGRRKDRDGPERRCVATGESGPADRLIRFALSPEGEVVPDLAARLPGRGAWLTADRALAERAVRKRLFSRAFRAQVKVADDLPDRLEALLAARMVEMISLARKAGQAVTGAEKVRARIHSGTAGVLVQARDGAAPGRRKMAALARGAGGVEVVELLDSTELGLAFGRDFAIHAALDSGGFAARLTAEARRLSGFRDAPPDRATAGDDAGRTTLNAVTRDQDRNTGTGPDEHHLDDREGPAGPARQDDS